LRGSGVSSAEIRLNRNGTQLWHFHLRNANGTRPANAGHSWFAI